MNFRAKDKKPNAISTHTIHPYTAKMIPQISQYLIKTFSQENDWVLDPFCGSGTTLLEANLLRRNAIGIDINPLSVLISKVKTTPFNVERAKSQIENVFVEIDKITEKCSIDFPNINYWFSEQAKDGLNRIKLAIENQRDYLDKEVYNFLLVCFSSIIRKSSNADPYMAKTYRSKGVLKKIASGWTATPIQYFKEIVFKNLEKISSTFNNQPIKCSSQAFHGDAKELSFILDENKTKNIGLVVTSPPYINAQDYFRSYKLELWWLGLATPAQVHELNKRTIGTEYLSKHNYEETPQTECPLLNETLFKIWLKNKKGRQKSYLVANYFEGMNNIFEQIKNVLPHDKYLCLITGNNTICETEVPTYQILASLAEKNDFQIVKLFKDKIKFRVLFKKRNHNGGVINEEWITVFKRK